MCTCPEVKGFGGGYRGIAGGEGQLGVDVLMQGAKGRAGISMEGSRVEVPDLTELAQSHLSWCWYLLGPHTNPFPPAVVISRSQQNSTASPTSPSQMHSVGKELKALA